MKRRKTSPASSRMLLAAAAATAALVGAGMLLEPELRPYRHTYQTMQSLLPRRLEGLLRYGNVALGSTQQQQQQQQNASVSAIASNFDPGLATIEKSSVFFPPPSDLEHCHQHNTVLGRGDHFYLQDSSERRPFSIGPADFVPKHGPGGEGRCRTVADALAAVKGGRRVWDSRLRPARLSSAERQALPSTFVPRGCDLLALSPHEVCDVVNRFGRVAIEGDSLARHLRSGFLMALSNDLVRGGVVSGGPENAGYGCRCDGQFSENVNCRRTSPTFDNLVPYTRGLCPRLDVGGQVRTTHRTRKAGEAADAKAFADFECDRDGDDRGLLLILNGGLHYEVEASRTYWELIHPMLEAVRDCADRGKVTFIWNSMGVQAETLDSKYVVQRRENVLRFNREMEAIFHRQGVKGFAIVDWTSFTTEAQTSDGVHHLASVNYFKAQYLLYIASLMKKENMKLTLPEKGSHSDSFTATAR